MLLTSDLNLRIYECTVRNSCTSETDHSSAGENVVYGLEV